MPLYEYECAQHGVFELFRPMSDYRAPQPCPCCGDNAARVVLSTVALATMSSATRKAHSINETSRHQPKSLSTMKHGAGCRCCSGKTSATTSPAATKSFVGHRPWMISH